MQPKIHLIGDSLATPAGLEVDGKRGTFVPGSLPVSFSTLGLSLIHISLRLEQALIVAHERIIRLEWKLVQLGKAGSDGYGHCEIRRA